MIDINNEQNLREIIVKHYTNPKFKQSVTDNEYQVRVVKSNTCADQLTIYYMIDKNVLVDVKFDGSACAVATASADIFINSIVGKDLKFAMHIALIYQQFLQTGELKHKNVLGELIVFKNIYKQRNRISCANLCLQVFNEIK